MEHIEAEHSEGSDGMIFADEKPVAKTRKKSKVPTGQVEFTRGATMYVNGKPIKIDKNNLALNKREKSNWLIHILFIRQEYSECLKFLDQLLEESERTADGERSEYALYLKALILRIKGEIHESLELFKKCHLLNPNNIEYLK